MFKKLLLSFLAIIGLTFLISSNTFADSDVTVNVDFSTTWTVLCSQSTCSNLPYVTISFSNDYSGQPYLAYYDSGGTRRYIYLPDNSDHVYDEIILNIPTGSRDFSINKNVYSSGSAVVTFSSSLGGGITPTGTFNITENGTYDVTNYAEAVVNIPEVECEDCDENFIVTAFRTIFENFAVSIIPVCATVYVICFMIDMITSFVYGRGR